MKHNRVDSMTRTLIKLGTILFAAVTIVTAHAAEQATEKAMDKVDTIKLRMGSGNQGSGRELSELCQGCHGENGISVDDMVPNLAGQYADYIAKELRDFQSGARTHQIMSGVAITVNEGEINDIAAYFATQKQMQGDGSGDNPVGRNLFHKGDPKRKIAACENCHGITGKGMAPNVSLFPVLGGQRKGYLRAQLQNWRSGERHNSLSNVMNKFARPLKDSEIEALVDYISGL